MTRPSVRVALLVRRLDANGQVVPFREWTLAGWRQFVIGGADVSGFLVAKGLPGRETAAGLEGNTGPTRDWSVECDRMGRRV